MIFANPAWVVRTSAEAGRWVVECKIPFQELDGRSAPRDGERWRVNFCRDADSLSRYSAWAFPAGDLHRTERFGEIVFSRTDRGIRLGPLGDWAVGKLNAQVSLTGTLFSPLVTVRGRVVGADAKTVLETENRLADYRAVTIKPPTLVTGLYNLSVRATTAHGDMYYHRLPLRVIKPYDISVEGYPYEGKLWVTANVAGLAAAPKDLAGLPAMESLAYPGHGNLDPQRGTLEFWLAPAPGAAAQWSEVLSLTGQGGALALSMRGGGDGAMTLVVTNAAGRRSIGVKGLKLLPGEFTHVAVTWDDKIALYVGGKRQGTMDVGLPTAMGPRPEKLRLRFGCALDWKGHTRIVVDELRVSSVVRYQGAAVEVPNNAFRRDPQTLLLDHLDARFRPDGEDAETRAEQVSGKSGELGGVPSLGCQFVEGRFGSGLQIAGGEPRTPAGMVDRYGYNASLFWWMIEDNATTTGSAIARRNGFLTTVRNMAW